VEVMFIDAINIT